MTEPILPNDPPTKPLSSNLTLLACQYANIINSKGHRFGDNPFGQNAPVLIAEIALIFIFTRTIYLLLRPLNQTLIISQIIAGIIMGPSILGRSTVYSKNLFPLQVKYILRTFADFGLVMHLFSVGVQIDLGLLRHVGKKAVTIGISSTIISLIFGMSTDFIIHQYQPFDEKTRRGIPYTTVVTSVSSFIDTINLLNDLKMLNSDVGRLASSTSMVSDAIGFTVSIIGSSYTETKNLPTKPLKVMLVLVSYYSIMLFALRPFIIWIANQTPEGKSMKESHFMTIICIVMAFGFTGECIGQRASFGTFLLGLCLPDGPPLGSLLAQKLEIVTSGLLLPLFCTLSGFRMNVDNLTRKASDKIELIIIMGFIGKFIGTILPSIFFDISFFEAVTLAFIMCCRGVMWIAIIVLWRDKKLITAQQISLLIANLVIVTAIATPTVVYLHDPSRRYMCYSRRSILKSKQNYLRILVCIHKEENVSPIINLLEVSNPASCPITAFVMELLELKGSFSTILKPNHKPNKCSVASYARIVNAFNQFQTRCNGYLVVQHFTTIAPYESMHEDICTLALDKRTNIVIVPYHKTWDASGLESFDPCLKALNRNLLDKAPCSVGILVDRGLMGSSIPLITQPLYHIAVLFIGGDDDREAIAYSRKMAEHPNVSLTVVWFISLNDSNISNKECIDLDNEVMKELKAGVVGKKIIYKEEVVRDGMGTIKVIRMLEDSFDLFIVGKHHDPNSTIISGLVEWNESPELGIIADILLSSEGKFSVLVVQLQPVETKQI